LARDLLDQGCFGPGMVVLADRKFLSWALAREFLATGAHILWRASVFRDALVGHVRVTLGGHGGWREGPRRRGRRGLVVLGLSWWWPGCRGQPFARVMAVVTRAMLAWSRLPRTRARWTGM